MAAPAGPDESANADLLPDTLQDGLDMDLLDDILSFGAMDMDWNKLEPSLMDDPIVQSMDMSTTQGIQDVSIQDVSVAAVELKPSPLPPPVALPIPAVVNNNNAHTPVAVPVSVPLVDMKPLLIQTAAIQTTQGAHQAVGAGSIAILSQAATSPPKSVDALSPQPQTAAAPVQAATPRKLINLPVLQPATSQNITLNGTTTQGAIFSFPLAPGGQLYGLNLLTPVTVLGNTGDTGDKIPMKRLNAPAIATVAASAQQVVKKSEATRRTSHNAIERRYRSSINDKILELKDLVCTDGSDKVHKAAILKSSIEKIRHLKNANVRLEKENRALKAERRVCPNCHVEIASDLRVLLQQTPPHSSESDSSTPPSPDGQSSPSSSSGGTSPIALFSIAAGLFLINPVYHFGDEQSSASGPHSRVPRSVGNLKPEPFYDFEIWKPRIMAMMMNLVLFMVVYYISGKLFPKSRRTRPSKLYQSGKVMELMQRFKAKPRNAGERKAELVSALSYVNCSLPPRNRLALWIATMLEFTRVPLIPFRRMYKIEEDKDVAEIISKIYLELSRHDQSLQVWCGLKGLWWALRSGKIEEILSNALLTRSKFILRAVVKWSKKNMLSHPMLNGTGLAFLFQNIKTWQYDENNLKSKLTTCCDPSDCLSQIVFRYKEEMLKLGVDKLYNSGEGSVDYFKGALQAVLSEKKARDVTCEWWTCILWTEAEWLIGGNRKQILERLYKVVDTLWAEKDDPMLKAVYFAHLAKREHMKGNMASQSLLNCASNSLRDSINMCLEKPTETTQYIWALTAEWVLEVQVGLWEETSDTSIALKFSRDLDTLRSLTHYLPSSLPTLYLYEACLRLMSHAAPGRTQQLLDASMKSGRLAQKTMLMCNEKEDLACKKRIEFNLVKEKRKAMALYLRCRFLPSQVITCPGEKAGMLREALKTLEAFGDKRKAGACLDMIKSLGGQSVTVH